MRIQFRRIACATDLSNLSNLAANYGIALAKKFGSTFYVCHVIGFSAIGAYGEFVLDPREVKDRTTKDINEVLADLVNKQHKDFQPIVTVGPVAQNISSIAEEKAIDLVITATRGRSGLKRLLLGSVTESLMRTLTCPLLVVHSSDKEYIRSGDQKVKIDRILVGCDFSQDTALAFEYGLFLARKLQSELHLVHVIEKPVNQEVHLKETSVEEKTQPEISDRLLQKLQDMVPEEAWNWCTLHMRLLSGHPDEALINYAEQHNIGMIVLGAKRYGLVKSRLLGSTTHRVIRRAPCPVLSVRRKHKMGNEMETT